jgi:hypothetical protein
MSVSFERDLARFVKKVYDRHETLHNRVVDHVGRSIRFGSATTGAPGQPVKSGKLLASWYARHNGRWMVHWVSNIRHARAIEHNLRGAQLRSKVGGFHSVKLTRAGFTRIVQTELKGMGGATVDTRGRGSTTRDAKTGRWK